MPNHIRNILTIKGDKKEVEEAFNFIKAEDIDNERSIDFNKITPMPRWVYGFSPDVNGISMVDIDKYGSENCSIDWRRNNWGTKWNAYDQEFDQNNNTITFNTAWSNVATLLQKIAWIFPNLTIEYSFSDEDFGYNLGKIIMKDTDILETYIPKGGSKEAYQFAFKIYGYDRPQDRCMVYNPDIDNYVYDEYLDNYYDSGFIYPVTFVNEFRDEQGRIPPVIFVK